MQRESSESLLTVVSFSVPYIFYDVQRGPCSVWEVACCYVFYYYHCLSFAHGDAVVKVKSPSKCERGIIRSVDTRFAANSDEKSTPRHGTKSFVKMPQLITIASYSTVLIITCSSSARALTELQTSNPLTAAVK